MRNANEGIISTIEETVIHFYTVISATEPHSIGGGVMTSASEEQARRRKQLEKSPISILSVTETCS